MKRTTLFVTSVLTAGSLALPFAAQASNAQGQYGLIDHKMGIAPVQVLDPVTDLAVITPDPGSHDQGSFNQYGIADLKSGNDPMIITSDGDNALPISVQLTKQTGLAENAAEAAVSGAVVSADGAAIGRIARIEHGAAGDTVYVRLSDNLKDRSFSMFSIDVPKGAIQNGRLTLSQNLSELMDGLRAQV